MTIAEVKSFGIDGEFKYERFMVEAAVRINNRANLDNKKTIKFVKEIFFLAVVLEGEANLYVYEKDNGKYFFYSLGQAPPEQLIYKRYKVDADKVRTNNQYQQQLFNQLKCAAWSPKDISTLDYKKSSFVKLFTKYNEACGNTPSIRYEAKSRNAFKLSLRPRWNSSSLSLENLQGRPDIQVVDLSSQSTIQFGLELEYITGFNGGRWSFFMEPTYRAYEGATTEIVEYEVENNGVIFESEAEVSFTGTYRALEVPIGVRYHVFLNDKFKLFANAAYAFEIPFERTLVSESPTSRLLSQELELNPEHITYLGFGANFNHKFSLEFRYGFQRELVNNYAPWKTYFNSFSLIAGYNFL
ncbi:MAG: hypothetical protein AB8G15_12055 [Saprospiraceae bacterium]